MAKTEIIVPAAVAAIMQKISYGIQFSAEPVKDFDIRVLSVQATNLNNRAVTVQYTAPEDLFKFGMQVAINWAREIKEYPDIYNNHEIYDGPREYARKQRRY